MSRRQDIINQIVFILLVLFIIFLLWGYGAGWLGASADVSGTPQKQGFFFGIGNGVNKLKNLPIFQNERDWHYAL